MSESRKQITFDLDTHALKEYYPSDSWNNGYDTIKRHMLKNGFAWLQGSVYVSENPMSSVNVQSIIKDLVKKNPWLNKCMRDCRETNIGREHDLNYMFNRDMILEKKEELKVQQGQDSMDGYMAEIAKARAANKAHAAEKPVMCRDGKQSMER